MDSMGETYEQLRIILDADGDFVAGGGELSAARQFIALCARGSAAEIETALRRGAPFGARDERGVTPLTAALNSNASLAALKVLLERGAPLEARNGEHATPLMIAAQKRSAVVVDLLVEAGVKVGARDRQGRTALMYAAAYNRDAAVVDILLRSGAQIDRGDRGGMSALMYALKQVVPSPAVVRLLLLAGADANLRDKDGWTPLKLAVAYNKTTEAVALLLGAGARPGRDETERETLTRLLHQNPLMNDAAKTRLSSRLFRFYCLEDKEP